ncbi:protein of unknown function [Salinihabitans flavidus]|uniref:DUF4153 domain-containing protein n=1 Tax=Salinihabitans flavidus TaxID=569882 RepID=A0A1H8TQV9_9RHOB|nr:DUF4153 domain-containing protein [Salinihabitans flavidus]SEO93399.1 protein of unknown function [Salinihabitans flavidus]
MEYAQLRGTLAAIGAAAGLAMWGLVDFLPERISDQRLLLLLASFAFGFFAILLVLAGPARPMRAAGAAAVLSAPAALLLFWASLRYDTVEPFLERGLVLAAWGVMLFVATPFAATWLERRARWRDYARLFDNAWSIVVCYAAAWIFTAIVWGVLFLSDALLGMVGITVIGDLIDLDPVPYLLTGLTLGLALAVVHELRDFLSPYLVLRLLRLLLPVVVVVVAIFILALPLRGLSGLFGDVSVAATLMAVAIAAITLLTTALDTDDAQAVRAPVMRLAAQGLALLLPVLGGLALWAVWVRVAQYGLTPDRIAAVVLAGFILSYALLYAGAVVLRRGWMARIRAVNVGMALALIAVAALWLTPLLNAPRIATWSQVARYEAGRMSADEIGLREMARAWGRAGQDGLDYLRTLDGSDHAALQAQLAEIESGRDAAERPPLPDSEERRRQRAELRAALVLRPEGAVLPEGAFAEVPDYRLHMWWQTCRGAELACVMVLEEFDPARAGLEGFLFRPLRGQSAGVESLALVAGRLRPGRQVDVTLDHADLEALIAGEFRIAPSTHRSLWLGARELFPEN